MDLDNRAPGETPTPSAAEATKVYLDSLDIRDPSVTAGPVSAGSTAVTPGEGGAVTSPSPNTTPREEAFSEELIDRAYDLGVDVREAMAFGSPRALERALNLIERRQPRQQPAQPTPQPTQQTTQDPAYPDQEIERLLTKEGWDPDFADAYRKQSTYIKSQFEKLNKTQTELREQQAKFDKRVQQQAVAEQRANVATVERFFSGLGDQGAEIYGKGGLHEVRSNAQAVNARAELVEEADLIEQKYLRRGQMPPPLENLLEQAHQRLYGQRTAVRQVESRLRDSSGQFLPKPTPRAQSELPPGEERAVANLRKNMANMGMLGGWSQ